MAREPSLYIFWQEMLGTFFFATADGMLPNKNTIHIDSIICFNVQGVQHYSSDCLYPYEYALHHIFILFFSTMTYLGVPFKL